MGVDVKERGSTFFLADGFREAGGTLGELNFLNGEGGGVIVREGVPRFIRWVLKF